MKAMMIDKITYKFNMWREKMRHRKVFGNYSSRTLVAIVAAMLVAICLGIPGTAHASYIFGCTATGGAADASPIFRSWDATTPADTNMRVVATGICTTTAGTYRMGLYNSSDSLLADFGNQTNSVTGSYQLLLVASPYDMPSSTAIRLAFKTNAGAIVGYQASFTGLTGPVYNTANPPATSSATAMPGTYPTGGTASGRIAQIQLEYTRYPTWGATFPSTVTDGQTGINITGDGFEALDEFTGQGRPFNTNSRVWLTQNNNWSSPGTKVAQTVTSWNDTGITFTAVQGGLSTGTNVYLWIENSDGEVTSTSKTVYLDPGTAPGTTTGTISSPSQSDTGISVRSTYTGDDPPNEDNSCAMQYKETSSGTWLDITNESVTRGTKTWDGSTTATLLPGTTYDIRATYSDAQGVSGTNPLTSTATTTYIGLGVGTVTVSNVQDTQVQVNAPVDSANSDTDSNATVQYQYNDGGGWTNFGSAVAAKTNQSMVINNLTANTNYDFRVIWSDSAIYNSSTRVATSGTSNTVNQTTTHTGTTTGTLSTTNVQATSVSLSATFSGDSNANNSCTFAWKQSALSNWSTVTGEVLGTNEWTVTISSGLVEQTEYDFRATFSDSGVYGTNPLVITNVMTPSACDKLVDDCMDCHGMPPLMGDHTSASSHLGDATRWACAACHYNYADMANVTSVTAWTLGHSNNILDIYTAGNVNGGISGGGYKGYRNASTLWEGGTANSNNVCANTYCHGASSPIWGVGSVSCGSCHAIPPDDSGVGDTHAAHTQGYVGYRNNASAANHDYGCWKCHPEATHSQGPATGTSAAYVVFSDLSSPTPMGGTYAAGATIGTDADGKKVSAATCTNALYCHSDGVGGNANTSPTWGGTVVCGDCHDATKTTLATNSHDEHLNQGNLGVFNCIDCHNSTLSNSSTIGDKSLHVNGTPDVSMSVGTYDDAFSVCNNTYCHSTGQATPGGVTSPEWGVGTIGCDGCHGAEDTVLVAGAPEYTNYSAADRNDFNGHSVFSHVSSVGSCVNCHDDTVDASGAIKSGSKHLDNGRDVKFKTAIGGSYSNKRCSGTNSTCHGSVTPRWGGTLDCIDCHGETGTMGTEVDDYTIYNSTKATVNLREYTSVGHGSNTTYKYTNLGGAGLDCADCHDSGVGHNVGSNPFRLKFSAIANTFCENCHDDVTAVQVGHHTQANTGGNGDWNFTPKCVDCHDPHGDYSDSTSRVNRAMIQGYVNYTTASDNYGVPTFTKSVGFPDNGGGAEPGSLNGASYTQSDFTGICQICHTASANVLNYSRNKYNTAHSTANCTDCHSHTSGFKGGGCTSCHGTGGTGTAAGRTNIEAEFNKNSHHINDSWANFDGTYCYPCHWEATSGGSIDGTYHTQASGQPVDLRQWTGAYGGSANVISYTKGTSASSVLTPFCLGCHNDTNASATPYSAAAGDTSTPEQYSWDGSSVAARYNNSATTNFSKYDPARYNVVPQITKAVSPHSHASSNLRGVATTGAWSDDGGNTNVECFDCHNSHGSDAGSGGTSTSYSSAVGGYGAGILIDRNGYTPTAGSGAPVTWSASADLCWDCHLADGTAPKDFNNFGNSAAIAGYYDPGRWRDTDDWVSSYSYKTAQTDSGNGDGNQKGGHFGASTTLVYSASTQISGRCTVCHDPHGVAASQTNAQYMVPALKGTWLTSPYKEDAAGNITYGTTVEASAVGSYMTSRRFGKRTPRMTPRFDYNRPQYVGAGYGTGYGSNTWAAAGGTGYSGYFIDDNTFGTFSTFCGPTNSYPTITDVTNRNAVIMARARHLADASTGMPNPMNDTLFEGLCNNCHSKTNLLALSYDVSDTTGVHVHNTVSGWFTTANASDLFKRTDATGHLMSFQGASNTTTSDANCSSYSGRTDAPRSMPAGYRWSVRPGTNTMTGQNWATSATPYTGNFAADANTQTTDTWIQDNYAGGGFHRFPCSKCHAAHTSKLPRLMKTNCIDVGTDTTTIKHNTGYTYPICDTASGSAGNSNVEFNECHNMKSENTPTGGGWNRITGW